MNGTSRARPFVAVLVVLAACAVAAADERPAPVACDGPAEVDVEGVATLSLPAGFRFIPERHVANATLVLVGRVEPQDTSTQHWAAEIAWDRIGRVETDEDTSLDGHRILDLYARDKVRGWFHPPEFDLGRRSLRWGFRGTNFAGLGFATDDVAYLGRHGILRLTVEGDGGYMDQYRSGKLYEPLFAAIAFRDGERYADFGDGDPEADLSPEEVITGPLEIDTEATLRRWLKRIALFAAAAVVGGVVHSVRARRAPAAK